MKKGTKSLNSVQATESKLLDLLKKVLPKATHDPELADKIYQAVESELRTKSKAVAFEKFCTKIQLPDLEPKSVAEVKNQLSASFSDADVTLKPNRKEKSLAVEVAMKDGSQYSAEIKVNPNLATEGEDEQEVVLKFVPFPVSLPGDKELVWMLAKRENMGPDEAGIALSKAEEDFWASKSGQKMLRDRVEKSFPEFISRVPAGMLSEVGLKRHYKEPEPIKTLHKGVPK